MAGKVKMRQWIGPRAPEQAYIGGCRTNRQYTSVVLLFRKPRKNRWPEVSIGDASVVAIDDGHDSTSRLSANQLGARVSCGRPVGAVG